jgi:hypothetical protein
MPETGRQRIAQLSEVIDRLERLARAMPDLSSEIRPLIGGAARIGTLMYEREGRGLPLSLRRHEVVTLRETATLLEHLRVLSAAGVSGADLSGVRDLLRTRSAALLADLTSLEEMRMVRVEPGVDLRMRGARIDPEAALRAFRRATGTAAVGTEQDPERVDGLFLDYTPEDLSHEERAETAQRILTDPVLSRFSHQELLILSRLRDILSRVQGYGYGVAPRRRPLFSKARRAVLWAGPRVGLIMISHPLSWRRDGEIPDLLLDLRRYDRHMRDLAAVDAEDDYFDARDPLIREIRTEAARIRARTNRVLGRARSGPSAFRFPPEVFQHLPGPSENLVPSFLSAATPITNAMAAAGIGGIGERDRALSVTARAESERDEKANAAGLVGALRSLFRTAG